jgi:tRNA threonylcarbamoyladenosine biosynthesis protein TsaB
VAGSALSAYASRLEVPAGVAALPTMALPPQALAAVARRAWIAGLAVEPQDAQPVYVRDKVAFTTLEREAARQAP